MLFTSVAARADDTRAIVDAATTYSAKHILLRIAWTHASVVRAGRYALFSALDGEADGNALLELRNGRWEETLPAKGIFSVDLFTSLGIPPETADRLVVPCPPSTPYAAAEPTPFAIRGHDAGYTATSASHRIIHFSVRHVEIPAEMVRFSTVGNTPVSKLVPATTVTVCDP